MGPTSSVDENDLLLYLIWGLDTLKENEKNVREKYWNLVYSAIYKHLKDRKVEDGDINYLTNLICACTMHCIGLNLAGNYDMQDLFCELNHGFGDKLAGVKWLKDKMTVDSSSTPLKEWVRDYMASDIFLTTSKNIAWDDTKVDNLPDLVRGVPMVQSGSPHYHIQHVETFNNAGVVNDYSSNIEISKGES